jgi:hypothetical protein
MCVEVEVVDVPLGYNLLLGRSWTYVMTTYVSFVFHVLCFPHEGRIVTIDQLSFSHPESSLGASTVSVIDNPQQGTIKLGAGMFPYFMRTFDFLPPSNDVKFISVVSDHPKACHMLNFEFWHKVSFEKYLVS